MNLHSPTTLLSNIRSMRNQLRSDKETLNDIKHQFSHFTKKPRPAPIDTILEELLRDSNPPNLNRSQREESIDKVQRGKLLELRRDHQRELVKLRQQHQKEVQNMLGTHAGEKLEFERTWREKVEEQSKYITILEEQVSSPIQTEREKVSHEQYDAVINQLLQENTRLHNQLQQARDDSEHWRKQTRHLTNEANQKSRLRFNNKPNISKTADTEEDSGHVSKFYARSVYLYNDENINRSNLDESWSDCQIQNDEGGLRTIREFPSGVSKYERPLRPLRDGRGVQ